MAQQEPPLAHTFPKQILCLNSRFINSIYLQTARGICPTLCDPMDCSTPGFPVLHHLPEFAQTHVHWVSDAIQSSHLPFTPFFSCSQSLPASGPFPMNWPFASGGQSIGASAYVLAMNIQSWFPWWLTGLISLLLLVAMVAEFSFRESWGSKSDHTLLSLSL